MFLRGFTNFYKDLLAAMKYFLLKAKLTCSKCYTRLQKMVPLTRHIRNYAYL